VIIDSTGGGGTITLRFSGAIARGATESAKCTKLLR
jgi:hypothetical protein